jgi:hypothetical protein
MSRTDRNFLNFLEAIIPLYWDREWARDGVAKVIVARFQAEPDDGLEREVHGVLATYPPATSNPREAGLAVLDALDHPEAL